MYDVLPEVLSVLACVQCVELSVETCPGRTPLFCSSACRHFAEAYPRLARAFPWGLQKCFLARLRLALTSWPKSLQIYFNLWQLVTLYETQNLFRYRFPLTLLRMDIYTHFSLNKYVIHFLNLFWYLEKVKVVLFYLFNCACSFVLKVYKGDETTFQISGLQVNTDYRFRVCVCRRCLDTSQELSGPFSPSVAFMLQRNEIMLAGEMGSIDNPKIKNMIPTDEQFAALIVLGFASLSIIFACILQYFFMK